jgi:predicted porin
MKKLLLATSIAALSVSTANAAPTVYGKAFITTDYIDTELNIRASDAPFENLNTNNDSLQINSNSSRLGFKGSEAATANTDVIYKLEYSIDVDGDRGTLNARDTYLGLDNEQYGQFRFGRNYSVTDYVLNDAYVTQGYWDNIGSSSLNGGTIAEALTLTDGGRVNNSIIWFAPKYNDLPLQLTVQYGADETFSDDGDSGFGAALNYNAGTGIGAGIALDSDMSIDGDILRGVVSVDMSKFINMPITTSVLYQQADYDNRDTEDGLIVSASMGLSNFARPASVYVQFDKTDNLSGLSGNDSTQLVVGGTYAVKDNMNAHLYAGYNSADLDNDTFTLRPDVENDGDFLNVRATGDASVLAIGAGVEYFF